MTSTRSGFPRSIQLGEGAVFVGRAGGDISFVERDDNLKIQINIQGLKKKRFEISAKLLKVAEIIDKNKHDQ